MNRTDVVRAVANQERVPAALVQKVLSGFLDIVALSLSAGEEVALRDFGKFEPRPRRAVTRRNPKTGTAVDVPEKTSVGFKPSPTLKARLNRDDD